MPVVFDRLDSGRYRWRLVRRTPVGADLLARGARDHADESACYHAVARVAEAAGEQMMTVQGRDGHWRWLVVDTEGYPLAASAAVFPDAATCRRALAEVRREAAALPVA